MSAFNLFDRVRVQADLGGWLDELPRDVGVVMATVGIRWYTVHFPDGSDYALRDTELIHAQE